MTSELRQIERLRSRLPSPPPGEVWIGDDAAVVAPAAGAQLLAVDLVVAGVHADLGLVGVDDLGWKALAVNLSDLAAMAGVPRHAVVAVAVPAAGGVDLDLLYDGLAAAAAEFACPLVGGDLSATPGPLVVSVAVTGEAGARPAVLRRGAQVADTLLVTGPLGASAAGLRLLRAGRGGEAPELVAAHRRPRPRLAEGLMAREAGATAMIDLSDGLATDVGHLARASGVGIALDAVPVAEGATFDEALGGGEDYELLFAAPDPDRVESAFADAGLAVPLRIGVCTEDPDERRLGDGDLPAGGWEHHWG